MIRPINDQLVEGILTKKLILFWEKELGTDLVIMNNKQISWDVQCTMHRNSLFYWNLDKCPLPISKVLDNAGWDALLEDKKSSKNVIRKNLSFIITWGCCPKILNEKVEYSPEFHGIDIAESIPRQKQPCPHTGTIRNVGGSWGSASMQFQHLTEEALCATPKHVPVFAQQRCITFSRISDLGNVGKRESKMLPNSTCVQQGRSIKISSFRLWPSHAPCYIYPQKKCRYSVSLLTYVHHAFKFHEMRTFLHNLCTFRGYIRTDMLK